MSDTRKSKPKSPATPSKSLRGSFADARKVYTQYSHSAVSKAEIASALGMSANSGPFGIKLFALKEYGLVVQQGAEFRVSQSFLDLKDRTESDPIFRQGALMAIKKADVFAELLQAFPSKLPGASAVAQRLETQKRFNAEKAKTVADALEDSLRFAGVLDSSNNILPIREGAEQAEESGVSVAGKEPAENPSKAALRMEVPVGESRTVTLLYPRDLTKVEAAKVAKVMQAMFDS